MKRIVLAALALGLLFAQTREIPNEPDSQHPNAKKWCQNTNKDGYAHNCSCKGMTDENNRGMCKEDGTQEPHGDPMCSNYCLRSRCYCHTDCQRPTR